MTDDQDNTKAWKKVWEGLKIAADLIGKVDKLSKKLAKQEDEILKIKLEQAGIVKQLELAIRFVEAGLVKSTSSGS